MVVVFGGGCRVRDVFSSDVPVFVLLQRLSAIGWAPGPALEVHSVGSDRHFGVRDFVRRRCYLQCLLALDELGQRGLQSLRSDQHPLYYQRVLEAASPAEVLCGLPAQAYKKSVFENVSTVPALEDLHVEDEGGDSDSSAVVTGGGCVASAVPVRVNSRQGAPVALAATDGAAQRVEQVVQRQGNSSSSTASSSSSSSSSESSLVVSAAPSSVRPALLPGLSVEEHLGPAEAGHYRRFCMQCPLGPGHHEGCRKKRNAGPRQMANFGQREPEAFLAAWAAAASRFSTKAEHVRFTPSAAEVRLQLRKLSE